LESINNIFHIIFAVGTKNMHRLRRNITYLLSYSVCACGHVYSVHGTSFLHPPGINSQGHLSTPPKGLLLVTHEPGFVSTAPGPHIRGNTLKAYSLGEREVDLLLPGTGRYLF
jgi:hypothetical protein